MGRSNLTISRSHSLVYNHNSQNIHLLLLGTQGCHLCDDAEEIVADALGKQRAYIEVTKIDIAEQVQWQEKYAVRIPVLYHPESQMELGWPFNQDTLTKFLNKLPQ